MHFIDLQIQDGCRPPSWKFQIAMSHTIHFVFGSRVGFSWSADRIVLLPVGSHPVTSTMTAEMHKIVFFSVKLVVF